MKIINSIKCNILNKMLKCNKLIYQSLLEERAKLLKLIPLNEKTLENIKFELKEIENFYEVKEKQVEIIENLEEGIRFSNSKCELNPSKCCSDCMILYEEVKKLSNKYNKVIGILKKINEIFQHLEELSYEKLGIDRDIYIKFIYDKEDNPICLFFDKESFDTEKSYLKTLTIYLSFGQTPINERTRLYFRYIKHKGAIKIVDFFSIKKRLRHGSYLLETLVEIIPYLNNKIDEYNKQFFSELNSMYTWEEYIESSSYNKKIEYIFGDIIPDGSLTYEELEEFYCINGFIKDKKLYKEI